MLFINTNQEVLSSGSLCMDECKILESQKPHIDIDCSVKDFSDVSSDFSEGGHVGMLLDMINAFASAITDVHGNVVEPADITLYSSCRKQKISFHLVYAEGRMPRSLCKVIAERTCSKVDSCNAKFIDMMIYTEKHNFRMYGSCKFSHDHTAVDNSSVKRKVCYKALFDQRKILCLPVERSTDLILDSLITLRTSNELQYVQGMIPSVPPHATRTSRSPTSSRAKGDFYTINAATNLYSLIEKAAVAVCGGLFKVRDARVPCNKYIMYNVDRKDKGMCQQCKVIHTRDNASCSLKKVDTTIAEIYILSIGCYRFRPPPKQHKFRVVHTLIHQQGMWTIKK